MKTGHDHDRCFELTNFLRVEDYQLQMNKEKSYFSILTFACREFCLFFKFYELGQKNCDHDTWNTFMVVYEAYSQ